MMDAQLRRRYRGRRIRLRFVFWTHVLFETVIARRLAVLVRVRARSEHIAQMQGRDNIPSVGPFVLAVNHFNGRHALDVTAVVVQQVLLVRPDLANDLMLVVGVVRRQPRGWGWLVWGLMWPARLVLRGLHHRWRGRILRIPLRNEHPSLAGLRAWRHLQKASFVYPEGRASLTFGRIRAGAGRWLATFTSPTIPVAVWWEHHAGWTLRFGPPLVWSARRDLHDLQLALIMADLLPPELAPDWQADLARWRAARQSEKSGLPAMPASPR